MWSTTDSPTLEHMREMGFPTDMWWGWVMIDCCRDNNYRPALYPDDTDEDLCGGVVIDISRYYREYEGSETFQYPFCNGRLVRHQSTDDVLVAMLIDGIHKTAWLLPLTSKVIFDKYGYDYDDAKKLPLNELHVVEASMAVKQAALTGRILGCLKNIHEDKSGSDCRTLQIAAELYLHDWPDTPILRKTKNCFQNYFIRAVS